MVPKPREVKVIREISGRWTGDILYEDENGSIWIRDTVPYFTGKITGIKTGNTIKKD